MKLSIFEEFFDRILEKKKTLENEYLKWVKYLWIFLFFLISPKFFLKVKLLRKLGGTYTEHKVQTHLIYKLKPLRSPAWVCTYSLLQGKKKLSQFLKNREKK